MKWATRQLERKYGALHWCTLQIAALGMGSWMVNVHCFRLNMLITGGQLSQNPDIAACRPNHHRFRPHCARLCGCSVPAAEWLDLSTAAIVQLVAHEVDESILCMRVATQLFMSDFGEDVKVLSGCRRNYRQFSFFHCSSGNFGC